MSFNVITLILYYLIILSPYGKNNQWILPYIMTYGIEMHFSISFLKENWMLVMNHSNRNPQHQTIGQFNLNQNKIIWFILFEILNAMISNWHDELCNLYINYTKHYVYSQNYQIKVALAVETFASFSLYFV